MLRKAMVGLAALAMIGAVALESLALSAVAWFAVSIIAPAAAMVAARRLARSMLARAVFGFAPGKLRALVDYTCAVTSCLGSVVLGAAAVSRITAGAPALVVVDATSSLALSIPTLVVVWRRMRSVLHELLDMDPRLAVQREVRQLIEGPVTQLRVWSLGAGMYGCAATLEAGDEAAIAACRAKILATGRVAHVTLERRG